MERVVVYSANALWWQPGMITTITLVPTWEILPLRRLPPPVPHQRSHSGGGDSMGHSHTPHCWAALLKQALTYILYLKGVGCWKYISHLNFIQFIYFLSFPSSHVLAYNSWTVFNEGYMNVFVKMHHLANQINVTFRIKSFSITMEIVENSLHHDDFHLPWVPSGRAIIWPGYPPPTLG